MYVCMYVCMYSIKTSRSTILKRSAGCANFSTARNIIHAQNFVVVYTVYKDKACVQNTNKN